MWLRKLLSASQYSGNLIPALLLVFLFALQLCTLPLWASQLPGKVAPGDRPKVGLALGGGGTRGAAHVGVLRVLQNAGVPVDMIVGTSMGAVVGGFYGAGMTVDDIQAKFQKPKIMKEYMTVPLYVRIAAIPLFAIPRIFGWRPYDGFYFGNKFRKYLQSCLLEDRQNIEKLSIPFYAVCTNLVDGQSYVIDKGSLAKAMQASSAVPILRRPVPFNDALLVDGAIVSNVPVEETRAKGADIVIAVDVDERLGLVPCQHFRGIGSVGKRVEQVFLARADKVHLDRADITIHPNTDGIAILSAKPEDAMKAIKAGEEAAKAALPEIREKLGLSQVMTNTQGQPRL